MESLKNILKNTGWISIIESLIFIILGSILAFKPEETVKIISILLGIIFIVLGIYKIIRYFVKKDCEGFYNYDLVHGLTAIVIGFVAMVYLNIIGSVLRIIIGVWIVYTSFIRINSAIQMKKIGSKVWLFSLILAFFMFVCGLYIILNSGAIIRTIGIAIIVYSIIDIIENLIFIKNVKDLL